MANNLAMTVYSGRNTTFSLPSYSPDGNRLEIYILNEPQGAAAALSLADEQSVSAGGLRRKVGALNSWMPSIYKPEESLS